MRKQPERTEQTKADLRQAFWRLLEEKPLEKITVGQVCEVAGYHRGTFYLHYQDLYELYEGIQEEQLRGMTSCVEKCLKVLAEDSGKLSALAASKDVLLYYERNKKYVEWLLRQDENSSFIISLKDNLKPLWRSYVIGSVTNRSESEIDLLLEYTLSGTLFMISRWLQNPSEISPFELAHLVYDFSIQDVRQRFGK